jgi:hypothetical protein
MEFIALGDFNRCAQQFLDAARKQRAGIAAVNQYLRHFR